jgi:trimeric autotransporter adhesin
VAMSLGALYSGNPIYKVGGKLEYRTSRTTDQWNATAAYDRKLSSNWSAIARDLYLYSHDRWDTGAGDQTQNRFQVGLAYRDTLSNKFNGLMRFEHRIDNSTAIADLKDSTAAIFSLHGNYHPVRSTNLTGQVAFKNVNETFGQVRSKWQATLVSGRYTYDINDRFDASIFASRTWGSGGSLSGIGLEFGARIIDDLWFGIGYNKGKFVDTELFSSNASWTGWHARLKYKLDY